jgi:hypothetical protein
MMTGEELRLGLSVLSLYGPLTVTAEHDQVWLHMDEHDYDEDQVEYDEEEGESVLLDPSPLTADQAKQMQDAGWLVDSEVLAWTHFC